MLEAEQIVGFPERFATARLRAERLRPEHYDAVHAMHQDPVQMATLGGIRDEARSRAYMDFNLRHWDQYGFGLWMLRDAASDAIVGRALLRHVMLDQLEVEVGYSFFPAWWGQGLATEIAAACLQLGRDSLGFQTIVALTTPTNLASRRVMEKIGMHFERDMDHAGTPHVVYRW